MAGFFDKVKKAFNFDDDDEAFDEFEEDELRKAEEAKKEQLRANSIATQNNYDTGNRYDNQGSYSPRNNFRQSNNYASAYIDRTTNEKSLKIDRSNGSKFIPINTTRLGNEVCIMKPISFNDSQDICDVLLSSRIALVNLEDIELPLAQRIIDFLSGAIYALDGKLYNVSNFIYIIAPSSVDISGDYAEIAEQTGFDVPVLNP